MSEKKIKTLEKFYCLTLCSLFIFAGCAHQSKRDQIVAIQKRRIKKLEQQIDSKDQLIEKMKVSKWVNEPVPVPEKLALKPLKQQIKDKQWVTALRLSNQLKQQYPQSRTLAKYRVIIFKKMGLKKQAKKELRSFKKLSAKNRRHQNKIK